MRVQFFFFIPDLEKMKNNQLNRELKGGAFFKIKPALKKQLVVRNDLNNINFLMDLSPLVLISPN